MRLTTHFPRLPAKAKAYAILASCLACIYLLVALAGMLLLSPLVPYADPWRFYARLLAEPWPANILAVDNGHAEILPNLVRWIDLEVFHGSQWLQILVGLVLFVVCLWQWITVAQANRETPASGSTTDKTPRLTWALIGIVGLAWFGSGRTIAHANESVHAYLLLACLFGALRLANTEGTIRLLLAFALGLTACLTFGTGIAVFPAIFLVLLLRRASLRALLSCVAAALVSVGIYYLLPRAHASAGALSLQPLSQAGALLRWLAAPYLYAGGPLIDTQLLSHLPGAARTVLSPIAHLSDHLFGPARTATWPELGLGLLGLIALCTFTWQGWRHPHAWKRQERFALAVGWFAVACGTLVALARVNYFQIHPTQIYSNRYLVWSTLFWAALLAESTLRLQARGWRRTATCLPVFVAIVLLPSTCWMLLPARHMQNVAARDALAVAVGALDRHDEHGENVVAEMVQARPVLLAHRTAMFAWPQTAYLGRHVDERLHLYTMSQPSMRRMDNAFGTAAVHVTFQLDAPVDAPRVLLVRADGIVVGMAMPHGPGHAWTGMAIGSATPLGHLRVAVLDPSGH